MFKLTRYLETGYTTNLQLRTPGVYDRYNELMNNIYSRYKGNHISSDDLNNNIQLLVNEYGRDSFEVLIYIIRNASKIFEINELIFTINIILMNLKIFLPDLYRLIRIDPLFANEKLMINISNEEQKITRILTTIGNIEKDIKKNINSYKLYYTELSYEVLIIEYQLLDKSGNENKNNQYIVQNEKKENINIPEEIKKDDLDIRMDKTFHDIDNIDRIISILEQQMV
jgi:hypothetical protein